MYHGDSREFLISEGINTIGRYIIFSRFLNLTKLLSRKRLLRGTTGSQIHQSTNPPVRSNHHTHFILLFANTQKHDERIRQAWVRRGRRRQQEAQRRPGGGFHPRHDRCGGVSDMEVRPRQPGRPRRGAGRPREPHRRSRREVGGSGPAYRFCPTTCSRSCTGAIPCSGTTPP